MPVPSDIRQTIDALLRSRHDPAEPGLSVIATWHGETVYRNGLGLANVEHGVAIGPDTVFRVGSITKQFTAAAIALLWEQGKLKPADRLHDFLPDYPAHGRNITLEHLLTHTAGLPNYTAFPEWPALSGNEITPGELIALFSGRPLLFEPGERREYSNSGYVLLGAVIEAVSGRPYARFLQETLFQPLGMNRTCVDGSTRIIPGRASGYARDAAGLRHAEHSCLSHAYAAGGMASTPSDLAVWDTALRRGTLLRLRTLETMLSPFRLNDGTLSNYGYGWVLSTCAGRRTHEHGGFIAGFSAYALHLPDEEVFVAVLANQEQGWPPVATAVGIAEALLGAASSIPEPVEPDPSLLARCAGLYRTRQNASLAVSVEGDRLVTVHEAGGRTAWRAAADGDFFAETNPLLRLSFADETDAGTGRLRVEGRSGIVDTAIRITGADVPASRGIGNAVPALHPHESRGAS